MRREGKEDERRALEPLNDVAVAGALFVFQN